MTDIDVADCKGMLRDDVKGYEDDVNYKMKCGSVADSILRRNTEKRDVAQNSASEDERS